MAGSEWISVVLLFHKTTYSTFKIIHLLHQCVFKTVRRTILTIAVCAVVSVPRLHDHSVRSLKHTEEKQKRGQRLSQCTLIQKHTHTETQICPLEDVDVDVHMHVKQKLRYELPSLINRHTWVRFNTHTHIFFARKVSNDGKISLVPTLLSLISFHLPRAG